MYHKVSVADLQKFNGIEDVNKVSVGQTIFLVQQAQVALTRKKYNQAIKLLLELKQQGNIEERQFTLEFLGVAREKKGQKAWVKQAYQAFISEHPDSKHFARVKMRLDNLIGIQTLAKNRTLSKGKDNSKSNRKSKKRAKRDYTRGSVSMDYRRGKLTNNDGISRDTLSLANTDLTDRRAIGGSARYFKDSVSFVSLLDYDIYFNALNALLLSGSYATESQQRFNWSVNYRKSPYVGTRNA
jgi:hypothetical protein